MRNSKNVRIPLAVVGLLLAGVAHAVPTDLPDGLYAEIETPHGELTIRLFAEQAPMTVTNFVGLAEGSLGPRPGTPYFDGLIFHRVVPGFVVQGGDPRGDGEGGPGYDFPDEFSPALRHHKAGMVSMANGGPDTNGSQFFITLGPFDRLNYLHSVFGEVIDGLEVLRLIKERDTMKVRIHRVGTAAEAFRADHEAFASLVSAAPKATPALIDDPDQILPQQPDWARINGHKLANFQRFGGAPLFIELHASCPVETTGSDLAISLARRAHLPESGVAVVYLADTRTWFPVFSAASLARVKNAFPEADDAVAALLKSVAAEADATLAGLFPDQTPPEDQRHRRQLDALLNHLLPLLAP